MNVTLKAQCGHCRRPVTVRDRVPAEMPTEAGERVTFRGRLYVVTALGVGVDRHERPAVLSYTVQPLEE